MAPPHGSLARRRGHFAAVLSVAGFVLAVSWSVLWSAEAGASIVQDDPAPTTSVAPETTSTLPSGGELGNIVPKPNSGREPETPGDPGGWQQVALFFLVCFAIAAMGSFVWWRSRVARARRSAAGRDPAKYAAEHGGDVRAPRPPGIVD